MNTNKITNKRALALALENGVAPEMVGKNLSQIIALWLRRGEIQVVNGLLKTK